MSPRPKLSLDPIHDRQESPPRKTTEPPPAAPAPKPAATPVAPAPAAAATPAAASGGGELATFTVGVPVELLERLRASAKELRVPFRVLVTAALDGALEQPDVLRDQSRATILAETAARLGA